MQRKNKMISVFSLNKPKKDCEVVKCGTFPITKVGVPMTIFKYLI